MSRKLGPLARPGRIYGSGALSIIATVWLFVSSIFFYFLWLLVYAYRGISGILFLSRFTFFIYDAALIVLAFGTGAASVVVLFSARYLWAGILELASGLLMMSHTIVWVLTIGRFFEVSPFLSLFFTTYDLPPQAMMIIASYLTLTAHRRITKLGEIVVETSGPVVPVP